MLVVFLPNCLSEGGLYRTSKMKVSLFISIILAVTVAVHASKTGGSSCSGKRMLRYYPNTLFNDRDLGSSQVTIDTTTGLAVISGQMPILANQDIDGKTEIQQLRACALNVKKATESIGLTSLPVLRSSMLQMTMYIANYGKGSDAEEIKNMANAFGAPTISVVGIQQLSFEDIKVAIEATVVVPEHVMSSIKYTSAVCRGNVLLAIDGKASGQK